MNSMSIVDHGNDIPACVCRCSSGTSNASSPAIHILAGEKVCIQVTTPTHSSAAFASRMQRRMDDASSSTGFQTTETGSAASSLSAISRDWTAT